MTCNLHQLSSLSKLSIVCRELLQEQGSSAEISSASPSFKQVQFHSKQAALRPHQLQFAALIQAIVSDKRLAWPVWNPSADGSLTHQVPRDKGIVSTILFCLRQYHAISPLQKRGDRIAKAFVQFLVYRIQWRYVRQKCFFGVQQARGIAKLNVGIIRMVQVPCKIEQLELSKISPRSPAERAQRYLTTGGGTKISSGCSCLLIARRR